MATQSNASLPSRAWNITKEAGSDFIADDAPTQAGAVAFYTALSFAPLLLLTVAVIGAFSTSAQEAVVTELQNLIGAGASGVVEQVQGSGKQQSLSLASFSGIISILALIFSASGVFAQLQAAMNKIWDVEAKPGQGIWGYLRKRGLAIGVVFSILFLLLASLVVTAVLTAMLRTVAGDGTPGWIWQVLNFVVSLVVYAGLFAIMYKFLPDVKIPWKGVWTGAIITAVLFAIGKLLIGLYLGHSDVGGQYGGAGSVVVLLVWTYYSAMVFFFGAELTQVVAKQAGFRIVPDKHARPEGPKQKRPAHATNETEYDEEEHPATT